MCSALHLILKDWVPEETIEVRLPIASPIVGDKSLLLQRRHIRFDLANRFAESLGDRLERIPEHTISACPADPAIVQPLLPVRHIVLTPDNVRRIETADLVAGVEGLPDARPRYLVGAGSLLPVRGQTRLPPFQEMACDKP